MRVTDEDRAAAEELASLLGVSSSELIEEFEQLTPEEQTELESLLDQANEVLPRMHESLIRMEASVADMSETVRELKDHFAATGDRLSNIETMIECGALDFAKQPPQLEGNRTREHP